MFEFTEHYTETVKLFDVAHFEHKRFKGWYQVGETVYNADNGKRVIKHGQAPCELLDYYPMWFTMEQAEKTLKNLGFTKKNQIEWKRSI